RKRGMLLIFRWGNLHQNDSQQKNDCKEKKSKQEPANLTSFQPIPPRLKTSTHLDGIVENRLSPPLFCHTKPHHNTAITDRTSPLQQETSVSHPVEIHHWFS